jgi:hypothetical protein
MESFKCFFLIAVLMSLPQRAAAAEVYNFYFQKAPGTQAENLSEKASSISHVTKADEHSDDPYDKIRDWRFHLAEVNTRDKWGRGTGHSAGLQYRMNPRWGLQLEVVQARSDSAPVNPYMDYSKGDYDANLCLVWTPFAPRLFSHPLYFSLLGGVSSTREFGQDELRHDTWNPETFEAGVDYMGIRDAYYRRELVTMVGWSLEAALTPQIGVSLEWKVTQRGFMNFTRQPIRFDLEHRWDGVSGVALNVQF